MFGVLLILMFILFIYLPIVILYGVPVSLYNNMYLERKDVRRYCEFHTKSRST